MTVGRFHVLVEILERHSSFFRRGDGSVASGFGPDERGRFRGAAGRLSPARLSQPATVLISSRSLFNFRIVGGGPLKTETVSLRFSPVAVHVSNFRSEEPVRLHVDLMGSAVIHAQRARSAANVHAQGFPGEGLLEDSLAEVSGEEQSVWATGAERGEEPQVGDGEVLRLVGDYEVEWEFLLLAIAAARS